MNALRFSSNDPVNLSQQYLLTIDYGKGNSIDRKYITTEVLMSNVKDLLDNKKVSALYIVKMKG